MLRSEASGPVSRNCPGRSSAIPPAPGVAARAPAAPRSGTTASAPTVVEASRFFGAARRAVVGDQHRHPRQRYGGRHDQHADEPVVPGAVSERGQQQCGDPECHQSQVFTHPRPMLLLVGGGSSSDQYWFALFVETRLRAALHPSTVAHLSMLWFPGVRRQVRMHNVRHGDPDD